MYRGKEKRAKGEIYIQRIFETWLSDMVIVAGLTHSLRRRNESMNDVLMSETQVSELGKSSR